MPEELKRNKKRKTLIKAKATCQNYWETVSCAAASPINSSVNDKFQENANDACSIIKNLEKSQNISFYSALSSFEDAFKSLQTSSFSPALELSIKAEISEKEDTKNLKSLTCDEEPTSTSIIVEDMGDSSRRSNLLAFGSARSLVSSNGGSQFPTSSPVKIFSKNHLESSDTNGLLLNIKNFWKKF